MGYRINGTQDVTATDTVAAAQVWQIDDPAGTPVFVDETTDFNDVGTADVQTWPDPEAVGDQLAIGAVRPFKNITIDVSATAGVGGTMAVKYWNGTALVAVANLTDDTTGLTVAGVNTISFDLPTDWVAQVLNGSASLFYLYFEVATEYSTVPLLDEGSIVAGAAITIPTKASSGSGGLIRIVVDNTGATAAYLTETSGDAINAEEIAAGAQKTFDNVDWAWAASRPPALFATTDSDCTVTIWTRGG